MTFTKMILLIFLTITAALIFLWNTWWCLFIAAYPAGNLICWWFVFSGVEIAMFFSIYILIADETT